MKKNKQSTPEGDAANITPPRRGAGIQLAVAASAQKAELTEGKWCEVKNLGTTKVRIQIGEDQPVPTLTFAGTTAAALGYELAAGEFRSFTLDSTDTHIFYVADTGQTGTLQVWVSGE